MPRLLLVVKTVDGSETGLLMTYEDRLEESLGQFWLEEELLTKLTVDAIEFSQDYVEDKTYI